MTLVWPLKFLLLIIATNPDGTYKDHALYPTEYTSIMECERQKPMDQKTRDGTILLYRCVIQQGA